MGLRRPRSSTPGRHLDRALEFAEALAAFPQETMLADRARRSRASGCRSTTALALEAQAGPRRSRTPRPARPASPRGEGRGGAGAGV